MNCIWFKCSFEFLLHPINQVGTDYPIEGTNGSCGGSYKDDLKFISDLKEFAVYAVEEIRLTIYVTPLLNLVWSWEIRGKKTETLLHGGGVGCFFQLTFEIFSLLLKHSDSGFLSPISDTNPNNFYNHSFFFLEPILLNFFSGKEFIESCHLFFWFIHFPLMAISLKSDCNLKCLTISFGDTTIMTG